MVTRIDPAIGRETLRIDGSEGGGGSGRGEEAAGTSSLHALFYGAREGRRLEQREERTDRSRRVQMGRSVRFVGIQTAKLS